MIVPNLIDLTQFRYRERIPLRPHLVCTRGFSTYYSVDVVVRAFAEVKKEYPEARLDLVGERPARIRYPQAGRGLESYWRQLHRRSLASGNRQVITIGPTSSSTPRGSTTCQLSVIEAFAAGTPVVTTSPESMPYLVQQERTGLLSPVGDEKALAANVIRLLRDPTLAARLAQNAHHESRNYTWEAVREQWLNTYRGLV